MRISPARLAAFEVLIRVERDAAYSDELLHSRLLDRLDTTGRGLATELVLGCLRRRGELDFLISGRLRQAFESLDLEVRIALRLGAYQLRIMGRISSSAAVSESVDLVKKARKKSAAGLVNAVLRNLPDRLPVAEAARRSHPEWLVARWTSNFGQSACKALLAMNIRRTPTFVRIPQKTEPQPVIETLAREGVEVTSTSVTRGYRVVTGNVVATSVFRDRRVMVQDLSSQLVASELSVEPGHQVLDLCAAPGGKACQLAEAARVVAADRHLHRLRTMRRFGNGRLRMLALDAEQSLPCHQKFDRILVDAQCSGTGTLARNPEIKWRLTPADLAALHEKQTRILSNALDALKPTGRLVYSTCSLEPEENERVIDDVVSERGCWRGTEVLDRLPGRDEGDGFRAWVICRDAS